LSKDIEKFSIVNKFKKYQNENNMVICDLNLEIARYNIKNGIFFNLYQRDLRATFIELVIKLLSSSYNSKQILLFRENDYYLKTCMDIKYEIKQTFETGNFTYLESIKTKYNNLISTFTIYNQKWDMKNNFRIRKFGDNEFLDFSLLKARKTDSKLLNVPMNNNKAFEYDRKTRRFFNENYNEDSQLMALYRNMHGGGNVDKKTESDLGLEDEEIVMFDDELNFKPRDKNDEWGIYELRVKKTKLIRNIPFSAVFKTNVCTSIREALSHMEKADPEFGGIWEVLNDSIKQRAFILLFEYIFEKKNDKDRSVFSKKAMLGAIRKFMGIYAKTLKFPMTERCIEEDKFTGFFVNGLRIPLNRRLQSLNMIKPVKLYEITEQNDEEGYGVASTMTNDDVLDEIVRLESKTN